MKKPERKAILVIAIVVVLILSIVAYFFVFNSKQIEITFGPNVEKQWFELKQNELINLKITNDYAKTILVNISNFNVLKTIEPEDTISVAILPKLTGFYTIKVNGITMAILSVNGSQINPKFKDDFMAAKKSS